MDDIKTLVGQYDFLKEEDKIKQILEADTQNDDVIKKKQEEIEAKQAEIKEKEAEIEKKFTSEIKNKEQLLKIQEENIEKTRKYKKPKKKKIQPKKKINNEHMDYGQLKGDNFSEKFKSWQSMQKAKTEEERKQENKEKRERTNNLIDEMNNSAGALAMNNRNKETLEKEIKALKEHEDLKKLQGELQKLQVELQKLQGELKELQSKNDDSTEILDTYQKGIEYVEKIVDTFKFVPKTLCGDKLCETFKQFVEKNKKNLQELYNKRNSSNGLKTYFTDETIKKINFFVGTKITLSYLVYMSVNNFFANIKNQNSKSPIYDFIKENSLESKMDDTETQLAIFLKDNISIFKNAGTRYSRSSYANYAMYTQYTF